MKGEELRGGRGGREEVDVWRRVARESLEGERGRYIRTEVCWLGPSDRPRKSWKKIVREQDEGENKLTFN